MSDGVLYDNCPGEPIAWARVGEPVIGQEWTAHGHVAITGRLSPSEAVRKYGPVTEVVLGRGGGFKSVTYGATRFFSRFVDPRGTGLYDDAVVVVDDPARADYECPGRLRVPGLQGCARCAMCEHEGEALCDTRETIGGTQPLGDRASTGSGPDRP
ncbi:hypothetical protein P3H15_49225 [Rhodococcus sp. T2V]|nr:hypothetical protein [Rhodococcus sp. T2V]